jgi:hypothetical protein
LRIDADRGCVVWCVCALWRTGWLAVDRCDGEVFETGEHVAARSAANPAGNWEPLAEGSDASDDDDDDTEDDEDGDEQEEPQAAAEVAADAEEEAQEPQAAAEDAAAAV